MRGLLAQQTFSEDVVCTKRGTPLWFTGSTPCVNVLVGAAATAASATAASAGSAATVTRR
jgi:hypothetical protein